MTTHSIRSRADYESFLSAKVAATADLAVRAKLEAALYAAQQADRSVSPLAALARVVEACDAIESGEAADLALQLGTFESKLRPGRITINYQVVDAYIRLREKLDRKHRRPTEWTGPRRETLSRPGPLRDYVVARQDAQVARRPTRAGTRARRVEEIIGSVQSPEDRQDLRFAFEEGAKAQRELAILRKLIEGGSEGMVASSSSQKAVKPDPTVSDGDKAALARLRSKLQDNDKLRHYGLVTDGRRLKVIQTSSPFLEPDEYSALLTVIQAALPT